MIQKAFLLSLIAIILVASFQNCADFSEPTQSSNSSFAGPNLESTPAPTPAPTPTPFAIQDQWSALNTAVVPPARYTHSAVGAGDSVIFWGGYSNTNGTAVADGSVYSVSTGAWAALNVTGAPLARGEHSAVWTGSKMIVWGGIGGGANRNDGGIYDPQGGANPWTPIAAFGPVARRAHVAVWTGTRMIIWGGFGAANLADGASFNPVDGSWAAINTTGAPVARRHASAIWTGSNMIVWGGQDAGNAFRNDGGIYDPVGNTWTPLAATGAPPARSGHRAVWTGSKMIIWGGTNGTTMNTGFSFDPSTGIWAPINLTGAPTPRAFHGLAWTSGGMIVWGGSSGGIFNTGGLYF